MKKILIFIFLLLIISSCHKNTENEFKTLINNYPHNDNLFEEYESEYNKTKNIIYSINKVNYPSFLVPKSFNNLAFNINNVWLVNTNFTLSKGFIPKNLVPVSNVDYVKRNNEQMLINEKALIAYQQLYQAALLENLELMLFSAYRSYDYQEALYNKKDNTYIASPGASEHQTGCALDIAISATGLTSHFDNTVEAKWLMNNAYKYGFIQRYKSNKQNITGYPYESWHYTYVGESIAENIHKMDLTLEEYFYQYILI